MMTCLTSIAAFGGSPACPFFADAQVLAVGQPEHSLLHSSSTAWFFVFFFAIGCLVLKTGLYSHQLSLRDNKDVEIGAGPCAAFTFCS
jgi:hypothetical protein